MKIESTVERMQRTINEYKEIVHGQQHMISVDSTSTVRLNARDLSNMSPPNASVISDTPKNNQFTIGRSKAPTKQKAAALLNDLER